MSSQVVQGLVICSPFFGTFLLPPFFFRVFPSCLLFFIADEAASSVNSHLLLSRISNLPFTSPFHSFFLFTLSLASALSLAIHGHCQRRANQFRKAQNTVEVQDLPQKFSLCPHIKGSRLKTRFHVFASFYPSSPQNCCNSLLIFPFLYLSPSLSLLIRLVERRPPPILKPFLKDPFFPTLFLVSTPFLCLLRFDGIGFPPVKSRV